MDNCTFCKIINKTLPGYIISETDNIIVFQSLENHPLVVPKKHIKDIYELESEIGNDIMSQLINTAKAVKKGMKCEGVYITQANEEAAGQDVFHIHFHVYPRWKGQIMNQREKVDDNQRAEDAGKVKQAFV